MSCSKRTAGVGFFEIGISAFTGAGGEHDTHMAWCAPCFRRCAPDGVSANLARPTKWWKAASTHFLMKTLPKVATEMALHVLAYNLTRVINIVGIKPFLAAIQA